MAADLVGAMMSFYEVVMGLQTVCAVLPPDRSRYAPVRAGVGVEPVSAVQKYSADSSPILLSVINSVRVLARFASPSE